MKKFLASCDECPWASTYTSQAKAEYAGRRHSCELNLRRAELRARGEARRAAVDRTPKPCLHRHANHQHGTHAAYVLDRCRCIPCTEASTTYESHRVRQTAYGRWQPFVDATPVRAHVRTLMAAGIGLKRIVALAPVSQGALWKLMYGKAGRPSTRVRTTTAERILTLRPDPTALAGGARVPAIGTRRRLQALVAIGWSQSRLGRRLGIHPGNFGPLIQRRSYVQAATARAVAELFCELQLLLPPENTHREKIAASRARGYARVHGWAPPLALDEDTIDDPTAEPYADIAEVDLVDEQAVARAVSGERGVTLTPTERRVAVQRLIALGHSHKQTADRLGITDRTVLRLAHTLPREEAS